MKYSQSHEYLQPTSIIDSDHPSLRQYVQEIVPNDSVGKVEAAIALYNHVRDDITYNPYVAYHREEAYRASNTLRTRKGYCVSKAVLLCALTRSIGIPSRIGFATVRNHIATKQLRETMGSADFVYHGYSELYLNNNWVIATPAFDQKTCERHNVLPLEFDGYNDSKYQEYDNSQKLFMEYLDNHGSFADVPIDTIIEAFKNKYGIELVQNWFDAFDSFKGIANRKFESEDVL